MAEMRLF